MAANVGCCESCDTAMSSKSIVRAENSTDNYQVIRLNHRSKITYELEKMFYEETLCDVTIICNGKSVKAHQIVLAASSSYFKEIFSSTSMGYNPIIFLKNFTNEDLNDILEFIYKGELDLPYERLHSLVNSAKSLGIAGLESIQLNQFNNCDNNHEIPNCYDDNSIEQFNAIKKSNSLFSNSSHLITNSVKKRDQKSKLINVHNKSNSTSPSSVESTIKSHNTNAVTQNGHTTSGLDSGLDSDDFLPNKPKLRNSKYLKSLEAIEISDKSIKIENDNTPNCKNRSFSNQICDYSNSCLDTKSKLRSRSQQILKKNGPGRPRKIDNPELGSISEHLSSAKKHCKGSSLLYNKSMTNSKKPYSLFSKTSLLYSFPLKKNQISTKVKLKSKHSLQKDMNNGSTEQRIYFKN